VKRALVAVLILAALVAGVAAMTVDGHEFIAWCTEQGGVAPNGWFSDPICVRDGLVLIAPEGSNARWPG
jgi:hypothetical protein